MPQTQPTDMHPRIFTLGHYAKRPSWRSAEALGEKGVSVGRQTGLCVRGEGVKAGWWGTQREKPLHSRLVGCCQNPRAPPCSHRLPVATML